MKSRKEIQQTQENKPHHGLSMGPPIDRGHHHGQTMLVTAMLVLC